jgi:hypothetical protein
MRLLLSAVLVSLFAFPCLAQEASTTERTPASRLRKAFGRQAEGSPHEGNPERGTIYRAPTQQEPAQQVSATKPATSRPRVGVALEGGGALGLAHIGVLKWFEEHHIPVDYLAGTSMGGLVGGLYSTGHSADELKEIVQTADWPLLLGGRTPYRR